MCTCVPEERFSVCLYINNFSPLHSSPVPTQSGGLYSAEDADQKKEGAFCVWTQGEIAALLSGPLSSSDEQTLSHLFCYHYGVEPRGNVAPHQVSVSEWV